MSNLLIGGAGLVGSHVSKRIPSLVLDNFSRGDKRNIDCEFINASVMDDELVDVLVQRSDCVFFFAAIPVLDCVRYEDEARRTMLVGLWNVVKSCNKHRKRLIYSSSGSVYAESKKPVKETDLLFPATYYADLKIRAEQFLEAESHNFVALRYQSIYGKAYQKGYKAVIQKYLECKGKLPVYGDGSQSYDFIHVEDVADANILAMQYGRGFYNVCTGKTTSVLELAHMIGEPEFVEGTTNISYMCGDPTKAEIELGFKATRNLQDYIKECAV